MTSGKYYLKESSCLASCPAGTYDDSNICRDCHVSCGTCSGGAGINNCISCNTIGLTPYYYSVDKTCRASCPSITYISDTITKLCLSCNSECLTCTTGSRSGCSSCDTSKANYKYYWAFTNTCTAVCPDGSYLPNPLTDNICLSCHSSCKTCSGGASSSNCLSCNLAGSFPYYYSTGGTCSATCPTKTYVSDETNKMCTHCHSECLSCSGIARTNCLSCDTTVVNFKYYWSVTKTCTSLCPQGRYLSNPASDTVCTTCHSSCKSCSGGSASTFCDTCDTAGAMGYYYSVARTCTASCPPGSYEYSSETKLCSQCNKECLTCSGPSRTNCLSCDTMSINFKFYWADSKTCTSSCPEGSFLVVPATDTVCMTCNTSCKSCSGGSASSNCDTCNIAGSTPYYYSVLRTVPINFSRIKIWVSV